MSNYSQIYIHTVFAVKHRNSLILPGWEDRLFRYITGIVQTKGQKMLAINGMPDHVHFMIGMKPSCCLSDLVREVKKSSNEFVNENRFSPCRFNWQEGFGAFSFGYSQLDTGIRYIMNQKEHHKQTTFKKEYTLFLEHYHVDHNPKYLFDWLE